MCEYKHNIILLTYTHTAYIKYNTRLRHNVKKCAKCNTIIGSNSSLMNEKKKQENLVSKTISIQIESHEHFENWKQSFTEALIRTYTTHSPGN